MNHEHCHEDKKAGCHGVASFLTFGLRGFCFIPYIVLEVVEMP